jgi:DNA repair protein RadC
MNSFENDREPPRSIKRWEASERPREKYLSKGSKALTDAELLAILIGHGYKSVSAVDLARQILQHCRNDLRVLAGMSAKDMMAIKGVGQAKALIIAAALELGRRKRDLQGEKAIKLNTPRIIFETYRYLFEDLAHEEFHMALVNTQCKRITEVQLGTGNYNQTIVDLSKLLREVVLNRASGVILMHNHPSGNLLPSTSDRKLTRSVVDALKLIGCAVHDHLIFGHQSYYSFASENEASLSPTG